MNSTRFLPFCVLLLLLGCGTGEPPATPSTKGGTGAAPDKKLRIAVIPKGTTHQFWKSIHAGAERAAKELGNVEIEWLSSPKEDDTPGQISVVKGSVTRGVDGICVAPNHSKSLVDAVEESIDAGIPVVIFDSGLAKGPAIVSYIATNNENGGRLAAEQMAKSLGEKGNVILLRYREGSESTEMREKGFLDKIAEYPNIKVVSSDQYGDSTVQSAKQKATQLFVAHEGKFDGIFAVCEPNAVGVLEALEQSNLAGKVKFVAFDPSDRLIEGMEADKVHGIVLQDPVEMGYQSVKTIVAKIRGQEVKDQIGTREYMATKENMGTPEMQKLLKPEVVD
jgi:ribose transport system substrate-binding protein